MKLKYFKLSGWLLLTSLLSVNLLAQNEAEELDWRFDSNAINTDSWACKFCIKNFGWSGNLGLGAGYISEDDPLFQNVIASDGDNAVPLLDGWINYWGEQGNYFALTASELGLETRSLELKGGQLNSYKVTFGYRQLQQTASDAYTPYVNPQSQQLQLPDGWLKGATTADMALENLHSYSRQTSRDRYELELLKLFNRGDSGGKWRTELHASHEEKTANTLGSSSILTYSAQFPQPNDQSTVQINALLGYQARNWLVDLSYDGSFYSNKNDSLSWQNPYETIVGGATAGRTDGAPDNKFNQLSLKAYYQIAGTRIQGSVAMGEMTQDETLSPYTINNLLSTTALPTNSIDAQIDTLNVRLQVASKLSRSWRVSAKYDYADRDNKTDKLFYTPVITDSLIGLPRSNTAYSFTTEKIDVEANWLIDRQYRLRFGYDYREDNRSNQQREMTIDQKWWAKFQVKKWRHAVLDFNLASYSRDGSDFLSLEESNSPQNPLLQKYNLADRDRREFGIKFNFVPIGPFSATVNIYTGEDDYYNSVLGLSSASDKGLDLDFSYQLSNFASLYLFSQWKLTDSKQYGSNTFSTADWSGKNDDSTNTAGIGFSHDGLLDENMKLGIDYIYSYSVGETRTEHLTAAAIDSFSDITVLLHSVEAYALYDFSEAVALRLDMRYEHYRDRDWHLGGIEPDSIANVLSSGIDNNNYSGLFTGVKVRYRF